jgi:two-component system chemotaxis sensor kinase CheA
MDAMAAIKVTFFQECEEQLAELESGLLSLEGGDDDPETVNAIFRAVHSIKGGAGAFALDALVRFAHVFETVLDGMRSGTIAPSPDVLKILLRSADALADLVKAARDGGEVDEARNASLAAELADLSGAESGDEDAGSQDGDGLGDIGFEIVPLSFSLDDDGSTEAGPQQHSYTIKFKPAASLYAKANETCLLIRELGRLGEISVSCDTSELPSLQDLLPEESYLSWQIELQTTEDENAVRDVFEFVDGECELTITCNDEGAADSESDFEALLAKIRGSENAAEEPASEDIAETVAGAEAAGSEPASEAAAPAQKRRESAAQKAADTAPASNTSLPQPTIRVDLDRVDRLIDLVGELVINQAMLAQRLTEAGLARSSAVSMGLDEFEQLTREIQESVMAIRAQPVKSVFQRMPRLVREVGEMTGKQVRLIMEGEGTEVDKTVIERLADPLTHMIRNAIDHGLESPDAREAAGKPREGLVRLSATHRSGRIVIEISDDGAGINRPRVRSIAEDKGLIPPNAQLSDDEIDNLIFLPGFSTASTISNISGRGVGMDVVKRSIQALGGRISISSRPGQGSTFTMSLPLTLAVLDGMVVTVADQTLVVPLTAIVETLQPKKGDIHGMGGDARVLNIRSAFTPLIDVGRELGYREGLADPSTGVVLLVETEGGSRSALLVDGIQGQRQVVIKSLEANYGRVEGIAAATILGDGRVALILDVDNIVASFRGDVVGMDAPMAEAC